MKSRRKTDKTCASAYRAEEKGNLKKKHQVFPSSQITAFSRRALLQIKKGGLQKRAQYRGFCEAKMDSLKGNPSGVGSYLRQVQSTCLKYLERITGLEPATFTLGR